MGLAEVALEIAERSGAVVSERCFTEREDRCRRCCVDLRSVPEGSVVVRVDRLVAVNSGVESAFESSCSCGRRRAQQRHRQCDFAVMTPTSEPLCILIEVKSGTSNQSRDVTDGLEQLICTKSALTALLDKCDIGASNVSIVGVVVSPATYLTDDKYGLMRDWSREFKIQLTQTPCGTDVWQASTGQER